MAGPDEQEATALLDYLAHRDVPCPLCGYNLRGLKSTSCPECNQALTLRVGLLDSTSSAYITTLVALTIGSGSPTLLVIGVVVISLVEAGFPHGKGAIYLLVYPTLMAALLGIPMGWLVVRRGRQWFATLALRERQAAAVVACSASLGGFVIWLILVLGRF